MAFLSSSLPLFSLLLIFCGIFFLFFSISISRAVRKFVPDAFKRRWRILTIFICFFVVGYFGYVFLLITKATFPVELLISVVFLGGALFVYGVIDLASMTIKRLHHGKESLENTVQERTAELVESNLELEASRQRYQKQNTFLESILESLSHPFYVIDVETFEVVLFNKASGFVGRIERTCHQLTHNSLTPCDGDEHPCTIKVIKETGTPAILEHLHRDDEGREINVEIHGYPIFDNNGKLIQVIEYVHNITDRKITEKRLIQAKLEAEAANKTKSEFLANVSHEIRTPMNAILGMTNLALATDLSDQQRKYLKTVKDSSDLLLNLINDILDFSKIEAGKLQFDIRHFTVEDVINATIQPLTHLAKEKKLDIKVSCEKSLSKKALQGDDLRLRQILYNLVGNAIKFTHNGGLELSCQCIGGSEDEIVLQFSVKDTGIGIEQRQFDTIFESFSQADASTTRNHGGTGLGLSICRLLVEMMGGRIWVESTPGVGSKFTFELAFFLGQDFIAGERATEVEKCSINISPLSILVVDDIAANRELAKMILEQCGHSVTEAINGLEALEILAEARFDAVLLDVQMPVMDGIQSAEIIRACEKGVAVEGSSEALEKICGELTSQLKGRHLPLLALTARATSDDKQRCLSSGMDDYVSKPFSPDEIVWRIANAVKCNVSEEEKEKRRH